MINDTNSSPLYGDVPAQTQPQDAPAQNSIPDTSQLPASRPTTDQPLEQPQAPQNQEPRLWQRILAGALVGLAGSKGAKSFGAGLAGGAASSLEYQEQQKEDALKKAQSDSEIRFRDAQAASLTAEAAIKDTQLHALPQQLQDAHFAASADLMKTLDTLGLNPTLVTPNTSDGAKAGLAQLTQSHGGVPPLFTVNLGDKIVGYDLSQLSGTPQGLSLINQVGSIKGRPEITQQMWSNMPTAARTQLTNDALSFFDPTPTTQNIGVLTQQYKNNLETYQKNPNADPNTVAKLQKIVDTLSSTQKGLDEHTIQMKQQEASAEAQAKKSIGEPGEPTPFTDRLGVQVTSAGGAKESSRIRATFKKDADNLAKTEGTFNQFQDVLNDIDSGKDVTGAQSVVALFNAIGLSAEPLAGKGFRINNNTVEEHANARGLGEGLYGKLLKLKDGDVITPQQIKDYADIALRSRHDAYVNKINEARQQGLDPTFLLPRGNGRNIDPNTATIFFDAADGNKDNARQAAASLGWKIR